MRVTLIFECIFVENVPSLWANGSAFFMLRITCICEGYTGIQQGVLGTFKRVRSYHTAAYR